jgi:hypothetical protein
MYLELKDTQKTMENFGGPWLTANTQDPNIFYSEIIGVLKFWKGFMWAANSVKFRWKIRD